MKKTILLLLFNHSFLGYTQSHSVESNKPTQTYDLEETKTPPTPSPNQESAEILSHLLGGSAKGGKNAYAAIKNSSKCAISVHFNGNKNYILDIKPNSYGRLLIEKGTYNISSIICNAKLNTKKNITHDFEMRLNN